MNINWKKLRIDYFDECVNNTPPLGSVTIPKIDMHPHNLFEWFKTKITNTANNNNKFVIGDVTNRFYFTDEQIKQYRKEGYMVAFTGHPMFRKIASEQFDKEYNKRSKDNGW